MLLYNFAHCTGVKFIFYYQRLDMYRGKHVVVDRNRIFDWSEVKLAKVAAGSGLTQVFNVNDFDKNFSDFQNKLKIIRVRKVHFFSFRKGFSTVKIYYSKKTVK